MGCLDRTDSKKWEKDPVETIHTHFYKHLIGLNGRATNILSRNEAERLSLKSKISIAKQCLLLSNQAANNGKPSFMLSFHEIMKLYCNTSTNKLQFSSILTREPKLVNSRLPKIKQAIIDYFKKDQTNMLRSYKKTEFLFHF